jgi:hypothetical protein
MIIVYIVRALENVEYDKRLINRFKSLKLEKDKTIAVITFTLVLFHETHFYQKPTLQCHRNVLCAVMTI